jgi:hypothetical protein
MEEETEERNYAATLALKGKIPLYLPLKKGEARFSEA